MKQSAKRILIIEIACLLMLAVGFLGLHATEIAEQPWGYYEGWRQSDTYSIALNYLRYDMNPLRPQLNYDGVADNYAQLELQIVPYLSALIFWVAGVATPIIPRLICLLFFLGSALFLHLLLRDFCGRWPAVGATALYLALPLSMMIARAIQPEACALFFFIGGVYFLHRFHTGRRPLFLWLASGFTAVAIMEKTPVAFVGLLFLYVLIDVLRKDTLKSPLFYGCGALTLLPPAALMLYSSAHSTFKFVDGIAVKHIFSEKILSLFTEAGLNFFKESFATYFGWAFIALAAVGLAFCCAKKYRFLLIWAIAFILECATIVAVIKFNYYLVFILPVFAALAAVALRRLADLKKWLAPLICIPVLALTCFATSQIWWRCHTFYEVDQVGQFIAANTAPEDAIAIATDSPSYMNAADRRGYRANIHYYDHIPTGPQAETEWFIRQGVRWFIVVDEAVVNDADGSYLAYLRATYPLAASGNGCEIYKLQ